MDEFKNALEGKTTTEGWDAGKLVDYHKFLVTATSEAKSEVSGLREAKRAEAERVEKLQAKATEAEQAAEKALKIAEEAAKGGKPTISPEMSQFRTEQVDKAKAKLFSTVKLTDEEKAVVLEKFTRLDTGKLDADFIYNDLISSVAAANPTKYLQLTQGQEQAQAEAQAELERQAAAGHAPPPGKDQKKYSDEALSLAKKADISPESATKQIAQGMTRVYN